MCIALYTLEHPEYALILCTNRDEYLNRSTKNAHFHSFGGGTTSGDNDHDIHDNGRGSVLSGIDTVGGGTWLGVSRSGKVAVLTNVTEPYGAYPSSRGTLVSNFLKGPGSLPMDAYVDEHIRGGTYAGFNMLLLAPVAAAAADPSSTGEAGLLGFEGVFVTNRSHGQGQEEGAGEVKGDSIIMRQLRSDERELGGMSNGIDDAGARDWPKVKDGCASFRERVLDPGPVDEDMLAEKLFGILEQTADKPPTCRAELRNTIQVDPLTISESATHTPYGTRLATVILVRRDGRVLFLEKDRWQTGEDGAPRLATSSPRRHEFKLELN
ncbi:DUF833-domain-containing protein [Coniophora puteana RWD-64-598 SS2]|uniref:DUF833-domain-containing protein n=1 Tax=Coniophora puteana (strain RWD-64-598) TaxID=741705 RepID=R7SEP9_CONPW|nr:DUF833-domain-containing protein [Coniophora puteana RWD-64-598 SS2]EIW74653.1 DUF833-domain-containing protein [Coniophora puteana RWD-64-598 SS2]